MGYGVLPWAHKIVGRTLTIRRVESLWLLAPEFILLSTALLILIVDMLAHENDPEQRGGKTRWWPYITLFGLGAAFLVTLILGSVDLDPRMFFVLSLDAFALMIKIITLLTMAVVVLISTEYMRQRSDQLALFYVLLLFATIAICLLGASVNLVMIILAFDFLSIISYILTGYLHRDTFFRSETGRSQSAEAALKYFFYGATLSAVMLYGMSWLYGLTGSTDLATIAEGLSHLEREIPPAVLVPVLVFIAAGLSYKVAAVPFHQWSPDAYEGAPTPVAAFLAVGSDVAGFALFIRMTAVLFPIALQVGIDWRRSLIALIAAFAMTFGNIAALWQENIRRLMAYSCMAQTGYILIGVAVASERGTMATLLAVVAYVLSNLGIFAVIITYAKHADADRTRVHRAQARNIADFSGAYQRAPLTALVMTLCLLSLVGIPGTAGFMGKLWLFQAAIAADSLWLAGLGVLNSVLSLGYYWKIIRAMYFTPSEDDSPIRLSPMLTVALSATLGGVLLLGVFPGVILPWLRAAVRIFFAIG
jgi:proton-translocating NADH-quinone oxidoreductase chain N